MILFAAGPNIKFRVERIEVLGVKLILYDSESFTEPLEVYNFPRPKEFNRFAHVRVVFYKP